jgi:hypothetical protein
MKKKHLLDLHIHSNFSDGKLTIAEIVDLYGSQGFSAIAITDHLADSNTLTGIVTHKLKLSLSEKNIAQYLDTIHREAQRAKEKYDMLLIPGIEVTLNSWSRKKGAHVVFLNVDSYIDPNTTVENLLLKNKKFFSIAAHPLWEEAYEFKTTYLWEQRLQLAPLFDAWECATGTHFSKEVYKSNFPIISSSDFHSPARFHSWKSMTYLEELSLENIFSQIKNRLIEPVWI